jgi:Mg2+ and Co2+ transporter CorA
VGGWPSDATTCELESKVHTKMTVAMEWRAVIAAVTPPVTAIASVSGMNVIVNEKTHYTSWASHSP